MMVGFCCLKIYNKKSQVEIDGNITDFESCSEAGNAVMESYPRQCRTGDGRLFVEDIGNELEKIDLVRVDFPRPQQKISSPLRISGQARGFWFFEASFPVSLFDAQGRVLAQGLATAQTDWMTEDFVSFEAELEFENQTSGSRGTLVLEKDNPSGLPENEDSLEVPVVFY